MKNKKIYLNVINVLFSTIYAIITGFCAFNQSFIMNQVKNVSSFKLTSNFKYLILSFLIATIILTLYMLQALLRVMFKFLKLTITKQKSFYYSWFLFLPSLIIYALILFTNNHLNELTFIVISMLPMYIVFLILLFKEVTTQKIVNTKELIIVNIIVFVLLNYT